MKIGNNVFIGMHSTILKGVTIGDNVIIGANSLINKNIPNGVVAAGNPCKVITSLDEYHEKRIIEQEKEAIELVRLYRERYKIDPATDALHEFFWLFSDGNSELCNEWKNMMKVVGNEEQSYAKLKVNKKKYTDMEDFLHSVDYINNN